MLGLSESFNEHMPEIKIDAKNLLAAGPMVSVRIGISKVLTDIYTHSGISIPTTRTLNILVDTGASFTIIQRGKIDGLDLQPIGERKIIGVSDKKPGKYPMYRVGLSIDGLFNFDISVTVMPLYLPYNIEGLIGRDILEKCILVYNGPEKSFRLKY